MTRQSSDHFDGRKFFNPDGPALQPFSAVPRMLLTMQRTPWPRRVDQAQAEAAVAEAGQIIVTFIGHATFLVQTPFGNVLTDPVYADRAGPFGVMGPRRVRRPAIGLDALPPIAVVLLSHNHYDHCDLRALGWLARRFNPVVVTPVGNGRLVRRAGAARVEELDWWEQTVASAMRITLTPAHHFSARTPFDRNRALWGGFMIGAKDRQVYFAGDSAYAPLFRKIRQRLGPPDVSLLPIGAYEPRWFMRSVHMDPAEAVQAHLDLESRESIATHFGTFPLAAEGIDEPLRALERAREQTMILESRFRVLEPGESRRYD